MTNKLNNCKFKIYLKSFLNGSVFWTRLKSLSISLQINNGHAPDHVYTAHVLSQHIIIITHTQRMQPQVELSFEQNYTCGNASM